MIQTMTNMSAWDSGLGVSENTAIGGTLAVTGTSTLTGALVVSDATGSTTSTTGALLVSG
jgi:hypothetical protein